MQTGKVEGAPKSSSPKLTLRLDLWDLEIQKYCCQLLVSTWSSSEFLSPHN